MAKINEWLRKKKISKKQVDLIKVMQSKTEFLVNEAMLQQIERGYVEIYVWDVILSK